VSDNTASRRSLAEFIRKAFPAGKPPAREDLIQFPRAYESEILDAFAGKRWPDLATKDLRSREEFQSLFTPLAYAYYLPAVLIAVLLDETEADILHDGLIFNLTPDNDLVLGRCHAIKRLLTKQQVIALRRFLRLMKSHEPGYSSADAWLDFVERFWSAL
jgi:hypothetical protein